MRKHRNLLPGARYHVVARANRQEFILKPQIFKDLFIRTMLRAKRKYLFTFHNFCIMDNHIHFIIEPSASANLSKIMQWILSVFAVQYNKRHHYSGHVWYDRFKSIILGDFFRYLAAYIYIMGKPVKAGIVLSPVEYEYCGTSFKQKGTIELFTPP
jgi:putative transposase